MGAAELTGTYEILDGERRAGTLEVTPQGGYLRFRAACRTEREGLLRLRAEGERGEADLGVLSPGGSGWCLDRRFSPAELRNMGLERIRRCYLLSPLPPGWREEPDPGRHFREPLLRALCGEVRGAKYFEAGEDSLLALPLVSPFPLLPIFCLGTPRRLGQETCLLFRVFQGRPGMIPAEAGHAMAGGSNKHRE